MIKTKIRAAAIVHIIIKSNRAPAPLIDQSSARRVGDNIVFYIHFR